MRLSELQHKDIIDLDGRKMGNIIDVKLSEDGKLLSLIVETGKSFLRFTTKDGETEITWDKIQKIGDDVILVRN